MAKKIVKKTKIRFVNLLIVLLVLAGLFFGVYLLLQIKIKNIVIKNTNYLNDDYIINLANIKDYPKFFLISENSIEKRLATSKYINKADVKRKLGFIVEINIEENKPLFFDNTKNKYIFDSGTDCDFDSISNNFRVPRVLNNIPEDKYEKFIEGMNKVKIDTISKISDIEYQPNDYDKDRFLLYMDDGNMVYLTLTKFKMINHYNEVLPQLEGHKGVLYLDSGNHFQIKE